MSTKLILNSRAGEMVLKVKDHGTLKSFVGHRLADKKNF